MIPKYNGREKLLYVVLGFLLYFGFFGFVGWLLGSIAFGSLVGLIILVVDVTCTN